MHFLAVASMKNRALIALITIVAAVFGGIALTNLKQELAPSIQFPQLAIVTSYPGATPDVVNNDVSQPIENAIQTVPDLDSTSAVSSTNSSVITAKFDYGTDLATAEHKLDQAINGISSQLPDDVTPQVLSVSTDELPVVELAVSAHQPTEKLADGITRLVLPELKKVDGVGDASLIGAAGRRVTITPDADKLAEHGLTAQAITSALKQNGVLVPGGSITEGHETLTVQTGEKLSSVKQIADLPLIGASAASQGAATGADAAAGAGGAAAGSGAAAQQAQGAQGTAGQAAGQAGAGQAATGQTGAAQSGAAQSGATTPSVVKLGDVASVKLTQNPTTSLSRVNGKPALTIAVTKLPAANTVDVSKAVNAKLDGLAAQLGHGATFTTVFDQAPFIQQSIGSLAEEGLLGLGFAVVVILIFLLSIRSTIVTAISIPTSVLITFIGLQASGYTLNIITLGGLTIAIGRVVDDSIVVIENIKRHLVAGADRAATIIKAVREVAGAVTASTITTVAVFLPIAFVGDITGELFRPFALTVTIALLASLLVALTIVPVLAYWFLRAPKVREPRQADAVQADAVAGPASQVAPARPATEPAASATPAAPAAPSAPADRSGIVLKHPERDAAAAAAASASTASESPTASAPHEHRHHQHAAQVAPGRVDELEHPSRLQRGYLPIIHWTLKHSAITVLIAVAVMIGTIALAPAMKTNFLGSEGQNTMNLSQSVPAGASLDAMDAASRPIEKMLRHVDGVKTVQVSIGSSGNALQDAFTGGGSGITYAVTTDEGADQDALQATVRKKLKNVAGGKDVTISSSGGFGGSSDIEVDVTAPTRDKLQHASDAIESKLKGLDSIKQVTSNLSSSMPYLAVDVDKKKAAEHGVTEAAIGQAVSSAVQPSQIGTVVIDDTTLKIYLADKKAPNTVSGLKALKVATQTGEVRLDALATVARTTGPATITTEKGLRTATLDATPGTDNLAVANADVQKAIDGVTLPSGTSATIGGVTSSQGDAFSQLGLALLAAILIVYIVMVATFRSLRQPLLLLVSVPFAATGAIILQVVTGIPLGVASLIGVLMLVGIVVTNAIVLVDLVNQYRRRGMSVSDAVAHGASRRLRPILMTALATIFALMPMALGITGHGGFISQPLALVVIGGLFSSTLMTLIVLPTLYNLVEGARERRHARRAARAAAAAAPAPAE